MVKFIGADKQGGASDTFKAPGINPQSMTGSDKSFQFAAQQQQQLGESLKSSLQFQSQTASRMSEDFSKTNAQLAQSTSQSIQSSAQSGQGFSQAMSNLANVGNMIVQTLDNRSKQEAAQTKAVRSMNATTMWDRVSQWEVDAPAKARLDPGGTVTLRNEATELFNSTEGADLLPEDREKLMKHVFGNVIAGLSSKNVEDLMTQQKKLQEINTNIRESRAVFESSTLLSSLGAATTQEEQATSIHKLSTYLGQIALSRDLDPMSKAQIQLGVTALMNKAMFTSEDNRLKAQTAITQYNTFQQDVAEARAKYPSDIDSQEAAIAYSAFRNNIPTSIADKYDITKAQERANQRVKLDNESRGLRNEEVARSLGVAGTDDEAGYDAELFSTESALQVFATQLGGGDAKVGRETPRYRQVVAAQKALKEYRTAQVETNGKYAQLQQQKARIAQGDAQANLTYLRTLKPSPQTDNLIKRLQIASGNNPALASMLPLIGQYEALDNERKAAFDNAYAQATSQGFSASNELVGAIDQEAIAVQQKLSLAQRELVRYGYGVDGTYDPAKAKAIEQRRVEQEAKRQAQEAMRYQQGSQGGTTTGAPFDGSGTSYFNGLEVFQSQNSPTGELIMPIAKQHLKQQGSANINSGVGWRASTNSMHNGQDIGVDLGTPITAQMDGKVVQNTNSGRAGNMIEIRYPDGSTHVFMHLSERPNLTVGQTVKAGQIVGKAGNTGLPGGNGNVDNVHLHWEVWYGDERSTPQEWSAKYRKLTENQPKQPRGSGPGASITAPVRGLQGVPIKGGVIVPDGRGGGAVVSYKPQSLDVTQTRQALNLPVPTAKPTKFGMVMIQPTQIKGKDGSPTTIVTAYTPEGNKFGEYLIPSSNPAISQALQEGDNNVVFVNDTQRKLYAQGLVKEQLKTLTYGETGLRDNGQQTQRPSVPAKSTVDTSGKTFLGPGGFRFTRDTNGNVTVVTSPVGMSSQGVTSSSGGYSSSNPVRNLTNSNRSSDYNLNDVTNDHGFKALKGKPSAARTINEVARDFGVPGEWLAEVISVETGNTFDPNEKERGGSGATGLIQFYPDYDGGSTKTINGRVYNLSDIGRMSIEQQLRGPVKDYLTEAMRSNGMKRIPSIQDLYALVWAYGPASKARNMRESDGTPGSSILGRLGKFSGRKYSSHTNHSSNIAQADTYSSDRTSKLTQSVDQRPRSGCATCSQMVASNMFVPHERVNLSTGMETFNFA
jgi:murein DD-endopeptidase MepM/ murein hydrolase activator NlpD